MNKSVLLLLAIQSAFCNVEYDGYHVIRFYPQTYEDVEILRNLGNQVDFWTAPSTLGQDVDVMFSPDQSDLFEGLTGLAHETFIENVGSLVESHSKYTLPVGVQHYDTSRFYTRDELLEYLDEAAAECGSDCNLVTIGTSYEGTDLKVIRISRPGTDRPSIWIDATAHAREWLAPAVASYTIDRLIHDYGVDPEVTALRDNFDWYIMNLVNPDGYEYTWTTDRLWRKTRSPNNGSTCVGTDANRNYDYQWEQGVTDPCHHMYRGAYPESEPEIAAVTAYMQTFAPSAALAVSLHCYAQRIYRPWGYTESDPADLAELERMANIGIDAINANSNVTYTTRRPEGAIWGISMDWAKAVAGIQFSYTFELRDTGDYGFLAPPDEILPTCVEIFAGLSAMAMDFIG